MLDLSPSVALGKGGRVAANVLCISRLSVLIRSVATKREPFVR